MGCVYLLGDWQKENCFKIGVTRGDVEKRIKKLQTGNAGEIYLVSSYETNHPFILESLLHKKYADKQILNEWYELAPDEVINFKKDCEEIINMLKSVKDNYFLSKKLNDII